MLYLIKPNYKHWNFSTITPNLEFIVSDGSAADARLKVDLYLFAKSIQEIEAYGIVKYADELAEQYSIEEIHRHEALEYIERRLDGNTLIKVIL